MQGCEQLVVKILVGNCSPVPSLMSIMVSAYGHLMILFDDRKLTSKKRWWWFCGCLEGTSNFPRDLVLVLCTLFSLKIKVSVSSGGDCIRTYKPEIKKGSYNNIIVNVKTAVADNLLFYLGSAKFVSLMFSFFSFLDMWICRG